MLRPSAAPQEMAATPPQHPRHSAWSPGGAGEAAPTLSAPARWRRGEVERPTPVLALPQAEAHCGQKHQLADNAHEVAEAGKDLYSRLATFGGHIDKLGRSLSTAVADFNRTVGSLERTVLPSARRMSDLGLDTDLPSHAPVKGVARTASAPHPRAPPPTV